jgi:hypothetical protein
MFFILFPVPRLHEEGLEVVPLVRMGADRLSKKISIDLGCRLNGFAPLCATAFVRQ